MSITIDGSQKVDLTQAEIAKIRELDEGSKLMSSWRSLGDGESMIVHFEPAKMKFVEKEGKFGTKRVCECEIYDMQHDVEQTWTITTLGTYEKVMKFIRQGIKDLKITRVGVESKTQYLVEAARMISNGNEKGGSQ